RLEALARRAHARELALDLAHQLVERVARGLGPSRVRGDPQQQQRREKTSCLTSTGRQQAWATFDRNSFGIAHGTVPSGPRIGWPLKRRNVASATIESPVACSRRILNSIQLTMTSASSRPSL